MNGATSSATRAMRFTPPMMTSPRMKAVMPPMTAGVTPTELEKAMAMPLLWTGGISRPHAMMEQTAKIRANHLLCNPFSM